MKEFNKIEEIEQYFNKESNTYIFKDSDGLRMDVKFNFDLNIDAGDINAWNINAGNIDARDISFYAVCTSYDSIKCTKCEGRREHAIINTLDGDIYYKEEK